MRTLLASLLLLACGSLRAETPPLNVLFLGDGGGHAPLARFRQLQPVFAARNITLTYEAKLDAMTKDNLAKYDGLMMFANHDRGKPEVVQAIVEYVESGKGFIPVHCASFCFTDNDDYVKLVGAQFRSHTTGVFRVKQVVEHPVLAGFDSFESWDETYVHHKHNTVDRTVLEVRTDGDLKEPWTWTRTQGQGRVFYTAWGHDQRTWSHPGFHNLLERGVRWACKQDPALAGPNRDAPKIAPPTGTEKDFAKIPAKVPFYPPSKQWGVLAEPLTTMQAPLPPETSVKHYATPEGFSMKLFAADEDFQGGKPMAMTWDERGRLWVVVTVDYPNELKKPGEGRDQIVILEDTNGDGRADKFTVFADKLSIPTAIISAHGGVIIHQAPHTLFLKDTTGDDIADVREILYTGWATNDTHAGPSNLRYGFDGWYYGSIGYAGFVGTINGEKFNFKQGYYRFRTEAKPNETPKVTAMEFLRSTSNNTWGFAFDEQGRMFGSTANGCPLVHLDIPNRYYERVRGLSAGVLPNIALSNDYHPITDKVRQVDFHKGFTSAAHCSIYTARTYPKEYWNTAAFVSDPTGHLTAAFQLQPTASGYVARYGWNLVASQDEWSAPIDAQVGPDGQVWVLDWYNYIVQHNPTPKGFTTGKGNAYETDLRDKKHGRVYRVVYEKGTPSAKPKFTTPGDLVEALKSDNMLWRMHAMRLIRERGLTLDAELAALKDHEFAAVPVRFLLKEDGKTKGANATVADLLELADRPADFEVAKAICERLIALNQLSEKPIVDAATIAAASHAYPILDLATQLGQTWHAVGLAALEKVAATYAAKGTADCVSIVAAAPQCPAGDAIAKGFLAGWPKDNKPTITEAQAAKYRNSMKLADATTRGRMLKLGVQWGLPGMDAEVAVIAADLLKIAADDKRTDADRINAAKEAVELRPSDDTIIQAVVLQLKTDASPALVQGLLEVCNASTAKSVGTLLTAKVKDLPPTLRPAAMRIILAGPAATKAYLDAVEAGTMRFDMLALDQKTALAAHPDKTIADRAKKLLAAGGGLPDPNRQKVIDELHPVLAKVGDVANGKAMFAKHCAKCHKHGSEGLMIGPDLTGFAVHPKEEILIAVLDPSRSVEGNFRNYTAVTLDGKVISGLLASESKTNVELLDAENKRHVILRADLDQFTESTKSLMPEGFEKNMTAAEMTDLLEFLTLKGKYLPIPLDKYATITSVKGMFNDETSTPERLIFPGWSPKTFDGVPYVLTDPQAGKAKNAILLYSTSGKLPAAMPKSVMLPCNTPAKAIHILGGVAGWAFPYGEKGTTSMIVRLHYTDGKTEDHALKNGLHIADYIRRVDVPESKFAAGLRGQQLRTLSVTPKRSDPIRSIELVKGPDDTAPVVMAVTIETP